jgi:2-iminobutanoate/2-iminopropanoate deaminase
VREVIQTDRAPAAIGPYSQAIRCQGTLVATAGQLGIDPATGELVAGGITPESRRALENLRAVLEAGGSGLERVVKVTVFLADIGEFAAMNAVYADFFRAPHPARSAFQVAALPKGARVEIEALAVTD